MKNIAATLLIFFIFIQATYAGHDPFNSYRWNRSNAINSTGKIQAGPWYEWWYYKVIIPETKESFFFVYGVVNPGDTLHTQKATRAYIEMGDFNSREQVKHVTNVKNFYAAYDKTYVNVDGGIATDKNITGSISENDKDYAWDISIQKKWSFNATGWATGMGLTNIEWYPAQADATCNGVIRSNGKLYHLVDAPCYQDRNWGKSFPNWWTWIVSNNFKHHPDTSIAIGGGNPKFLGSDFLKGVAVGLKHKGKTYEFRPNDLDRVKIDINFGKWEVTAQNRKYKVEVSAYAPKEAFMDLQFMTPTGEIFHDYETLTGKMSVKLYRRKRTSRSRVPSWTLIDTLDSDTAGIEYGSRDVNKGRLLWPSQTAKHKYKHIYRNQHKFPYQ